jgi:hypothetical protein
MYIWELVYDEGGTADEWGKVDYLIGDAATLTIHRKAKSDRNSFYMQSKLQLD